jgi:hypothetical protein
VQCVRRWMPYECAESSHAVEHRSRATCASGTPTLMLVTAIMPLLAAHRFFLVSVHASAAKRVRLRDAVRRVAAASMAGMVLRALRQPCDRRAGSAGFRGRKNAAFVRSGTNAARAAVPSWRREAPGSKNPQPLRADEAPDTSMPDLASLLGTVGGAVLAVYLIRLYRERCTRTGWLRSGQEASHRLHRA